MGYRALLVKDPRGVEQPIRGKYVVMLYSYDSISNSFKEVANTAFDALSGSEGAIRYALRVYVQTGTRMNDTACVSDTSM